MARGKHLTTAEQEFIRTNCKTMTASEIANALGRHPGSITGWCSRNGLICKCARWKTPKPGGERRIYERAEHPVKIQRPPAVYGNLPSPYGIADEVHRRSQIQNQL